MERLHKRSEREASAESAESPTARGYIIAIVGVVGGALILPPFPLLMLGIIALACITLVIISCVCLLQYVFHISKRRSLLQTSQGYVQEPLPAPVYSHAPSPTNHA